MNAVEQWQAVYGVHLISMCRMGEMLNLTAAEREVCGIRTIDAVDETRAERKARLAEARKAADREAKRAKRGRVAREVYEGSSLSKTKPWEAEGISRRTWERRRARVASVSAHHIYPSLQNRTHLRQGSTSMLEDPARIDSKTLDVGAGVPTAHGLSGGEQPSVSLISQKEEDQHDLVQLHGGDLGTEPPIVQRHPALAHLPDPSHAADRQAILWQREQGLTRITLVSNLETSA
jgi:hypothetical protein